MQTEHAQEQTATAVADTRALSRTEHRTLQTLFHHPVAHNLAWSDVVALFERHGSVEQRANSEVVFRIGDATHPMRKPHDKQLTAPEVVALRHFAAQAGWSADMAAATPAGAAAAPALLIVMDHHEAKIYQVDDMQTPSGVRAIKPHDPHHFLHHLTHKEQSRERGQRAPEEAAYYTEIAEALASGGRIVLAGHGTGKSNAVHHLADFLRAHHVETSQRVACELDVDLSSVTLPQMLEMARQALR
jgi:hypothetical protein